MKASICAFSATTMSAVTRFVPPVSLCRLPGAVAISAIRTHRSRSRPSEHLVELATAHALARATPSAACASSTVPYAVGAQSFRTRPP